MRHFVLPLLLFLLVSAFSQAQNDSTALLKYQEGVYFEDGIYLSFDEFKNNSPKIHEYEVINDNTFGEIGRVLLRFNCEDDKGNIKSCSVKDCFCYVRKGVVYIYQGYFGYYYRAFIVGALTHYLAFSHAVTPKMYMSDQPVAYVGSTENYQEFVIDFNTGKEIPFKYKNFSDFLKDNDTELYNQLQKSKQKRKMIHNFLLRYNERHPIYIPVEKIEE